MDELTELIAQARTLPREELLDWAKELFELQVEKAASCGLPRDASYTAMLQIAITRLQDDMGPEQLGYLLMSVGGSLVKAANPDRGTA